MEAALKVMLPTLLLCPMVSEVDCGHMAVEAEPSWQYCVTSVICATDDSRETIWQNNIWHGKVFEIKVWHWIPPWGKNGTHWCSLTIAKCWTSYSGHEHKWGSGSVLQQWQQEDERQATFQIVMHILKTRHTGSCSLLTLLRNSSL